MINILMNQSIRYTGLGDKLDLMCLAKILHDRTKEPVKLHQTSAVFKDFNFFKTLYDMPIEYEYYPVYLDTDEIKFASYIEHNLKGFKQVDIYRSVSDFPKITPKQFDFELPEKFVTFQVDSNQTQAKCSPDEILRIKAYYREQGYKLVTVGGKSKNENLQGKNECIDKIIYAMSKAALHVGTDSGMMNLAKLVMPTSNIHIYTSDKKENKDYLSSFVKRCIEKGAKVNYSRG